MLKLRKPNVNEEMLRKNAEVIKNLSDKIDKVESSISSNDSKDKMDDLLVEVEKRKAEKIVLEKANAEKIAINEDKGHEGHVHTHTHNLSFDKDGIATCVGKECGKKFAMVAVPSADDWNKDMPDPETNAERDFDPNKVHDIYSCSDCGTMVHGPKRENVGIENKLDTCPFCNSEKQYFKPVNLKELGRRIGKLK